MEMSKTNNIELTLFSIVNYTVGFGVETRDKMGLKPGR